MQKCSTHRRRFSSQDQGSALMPCSCGLSRGMGGRSGSFSIFLAPTGFHGQPEEGDRSSSQVDCTLSLGTPSTGHQSKPHSKASTLSLISQQKPHNYPLRFDSMPFQPDQTPSTETGGGLIPAIRETGTGGSSFNLGGDPLLGRRCANCDTTTTPLWRNGPRGPKSLCNACGIRHKKEERRAGSFAGNPSSTSSSTTLSTASHLELPSNHLQQAVGCGYQNPWTCPTFPGGQTFPLPTMRRSSHTASSEPVGNSGAER
ncbi:unnamed protein product [Spirodela intermedia]|uniref:GATA-type domain-containing protein n=2 Tax=Spirodela intermedia TaxID=51605 RepID=A0A7I8LGD9_SPIIN|nr:unnamed protein product [Spirodela intermedia]CAA6671254.1 unnamed protein product [Spirodela intermedia]CAA7408345.1 unnamed protein product [Spirodela intermedia]